ncbi:glutathione reductase (NADPH) [Rubricella aquisinus]|uniref:Glutathione reductase n=1 Tax=Rubricella aquisinus TaxID=2028108 RepID=A0A840X2P5_9RHOB|nr:glutathione-disulfide reductase [Rubricella aquisinus]MBB5516116.1 glutathione reductase (NADPH) [Rubricella aquisinus]
MAFDYDLFVIGGGSGGVRAARVAAQTGVSVALAEEYRYGGTCVIRGCVPKKLMVYASQFSEHFEDAAGYGWSVGETKFDWATLHANKDKEIDRLEGIYQRILDTNEVTHYRTRATVKDAHTVTLDDGTEFSAKHILIATGGRPFLPKVPGIEHAITSNEIFLLKEQPKRILIVGGGYIACEFAGIMNGLGSEVTLAYRGAQILRGFDDDIRSHVSAEMVKKGIDVCLGMDVASISKEEDGLVVDLNQGETRTFDAVLYATGRVPNTDGMGLEEIGVALDKNGAVVVDAYSQTNIPSIYAIGDVTDRVQLTPVAIREGMAFVETVFKGNPTKPDHDLIPTAVFTQPEIGTVGMTQKQAEDLGHELDIYRTAFRSMLHVLAGRDERMLMKLIVDCDTDKVLGCHIVGHAAGEMIQLAGIAVKMGATKADFDRTVAVHPTAAEELVTLKDPIKRLEN